MAKDENKEVELDITKKYSLSDKLVCIEYKDFWIIINPDTSNWIVLKNRNQLEIFNILKEVSIQECITRLGEQLVETDLIAVLTELEAKQFDQDYVNYPERNGICIYLTNACNLRCPHCYMYAAKEMENELTTNEVIELLDAFYTNGCRVVTFTGGEVTLRTDFIDILKHAKGLGYKTTVLSNGTNWSDELIEQIPAYVDEVQISIDGYDEESNATIRGKGNFARSLSTVEKLVNKNIRTSVAVTPLLETLETDKEKYISFAKELINKYPEDQFFVKFNVELLEGRNINPTSDNNLRYRKLMKEITKACYDNYQENDFVLNHENNTVFNNCGFGGITVSPIGDIYFCNRIYELKSYANYRKDSLTHIMELSRKAMELSDINNLKPCCNCELKHICGGGCRITYFNELATCDNIETFDVSKVPARKCDFDNKKFYYEMMIKTNELFYR
ncbi:MAG: radical SAM protein [Ruminococcus sp.]|nr:radical SAM protein [Ruminococcus sp.]